MEKIYSKEIIMILEKIAKAIVSSETQEIRIVKNNRGRFSITKTESINLEIRN
ncbi:MAG: hypothetical protein ACRCU6_00220 [Fusobacteriaceae bacterium]